MQMFSRNLTSPFGLPEAYRFNAERFSAAVEAFGVEPVSIECLSRNRRGFKFSLCSGTNEFEVTVDNSRAKLALIRMNQPPETLAEGGAGSEMVWRRFSAIIKGLEGK